MSTAVALESCGSTTTWVDATDTPRDHTAGHLLALMDQYERPLYGFLVNLVGPHDAADGTQETFLRAYDHLRRGQGVTKGWLYTVARHLALDQLRHSQRTCPHAEVPEQMPQPPPSDRADLVRRTLARLAPEESEVLYLFEVDGAVLQMRTQARLLTIRQFGAPGQQLPEPIVGSHITHLTPMIPIPTRACPMPPSQPF
jgi:hypothetical protein